MSTPRDILNYVMENKLEIDFLNALTSNKLNYSIGEIVDKEFTYVNSVCRFKTKSFNLDIRIEDDEIITAVANKLYVSAFISRYEDKYEVHFLCHQYPQSMKARFEEEIANEVVRYMILKTIVTLRLDTLQKLEVYIK